MKLIILLSFFISVYSYATEDHIIDLDMKKCLSLEANQTTSGMNDCVLKATEAWNLELDKIYNKLMDELSVDGNKKLELSQRQWIAYRDTEFTFLKEMYNRKEFSGSMYSNMNNMDALNVVKNRTLVLTRYAKRHKI